MNIYSLRAECMTDADQLKKLVNVACAVSELSMKADEDGMPDQEIEIRTELTLDELLTMIRAIPDGHVMLQTLEPVPLAENSLDLVEDTTLHRDGLREFITPFMSPC